MARADEKPSLKWPTISLIAGQTADTVTTLRAFDHGCHEANPLIGPNPSTQKIVAVKAMTVGGALTTMYLLRKVGAPKAAAFVGHFGGAVGGFAAVNNSVRCR